jgi:hypothetical protein
MSNFKKNVKSIASNSVNVPVEGVALAVEITADTANLAMDTVSQE